MNVIAMELKNIEREKFDESLAKRQICQYFSLLINSAIWYVCIYILEFFCNNGTVNYVLLIYIKFESL